MKRKTLFAAAVRLACLVGVALASAGCATRLDSLHARYLEPDYVITKEFYAEAPQRLAVLPFVMSSDHAAKSETADVCRRTFYQQVVLRDYETTAPRSSDISLLGTNREYRTGTFGFLTKAIRALDVVGMTTVMDLNALTSDSEEIPHYEFRELIAAAHTNAHADACCIGVTRKFGRFYAVVFSTVGISTRVEMWSAASGRLLWAAQMKGRNMDAAITIDPLAVPLKLYDVWMNARGHTLGALAYDVYGHICQTMPYTPVPHTVSVESTCEKARVFKTLSPYRIWCASRVKKGTFLTFLREENGWYQCQREDGSTIWIFRGDARLVDEKRAPINPRADYVPTR